MNMKINLRKRSGDILSQRTFFTDKFFSSFRNYKDLGFGEITI